MFSKLRLPNFFAHNILQFMQNRAASSIKGDLNKSVSQSSPCEECKVTVVGRFGFYCLWSILRNTYCTICHIYNNSGKEEHTFSNRYVGTCFLNYSDDRLIMSEDYNCATGSKVCVITSELTKEDDESSSLEELIQKNADIVKDIVKKLVEKNPNAILLIVTNPVDIMSYVAWKTSNFPHERVIGVGTCLDTARFRYCLGEKLDIVPSSVQACVIGRLGNPIPAWSGAKVGGTNVKDLIPNLDLQICKDNWHEEKFASKLIGPAVGEIITAILGNKLHVMPVSTMVKGLHNIDQETYLSLPCALGCNGITQIIKQDLSQEEKDNLLKAVEYNLSIQKSIII